MDPVTYRNAEGQERIVSSAAGAVRAEYDGFYDPDSPSGQRLSQLAETADETPTESWTHRRLDEYAAARNVSVSGSKADKVATLTAPADAELEPGATGEDVPAQEPEPGVHYA